MFFKQRLLDKFSKGWTGRLVESSRANFYLRTSTHSLEIEVGRWARPNRILIDERKCRTCSKLENEFHFLLECSLYNDLNELVYQKILLEKTLYINT